MNDTTEDNYINKVAEFMTTAGQPVHEAPIIMPEDRARLRIALIFEELREYAEASGQIYYFDELCEKWLANSHNMTQVHPHPTRVDPVEQLDALCDMQYVLSGAVIENGFKNVFDEAFDEVQRSNMSKFCKDEDEAIQTVASYTNQNIETYYEKVDNLYVIRRTEDHKILKSINYSPADLKRFIPSAGIK
jgi:predicted HAD superfamily Cof-like phosphohydrolase